MDSHQSSREALTSDSIPRHQPVDERPFRFLDLPTELRLLVYEHISDDQIEGKLKGDANIFKILAIHLRINTLPIALLATCRLIRSEAKTIMYSKIEELPLPCVSISSKFLYAHNYRMFSRYQPFGLLLHSLGRVDPNSPMEDRDIRITQTGTASLADFILWVRVMHNAVTLESYIHPDFEVRFIFEENRDLTLMPAFQQKLYMFMSDLQTVCREHDLIAKIGISLFDGREASVDKRRRFFDTFRMLVDEEEDLTSLVCATHLSQKEIKEWEQGLRGMDDPYAEY